MKKLLIVCIVFLSALNAGLLDKVGLFDKEVVIKHADSNMQREYPTQRNMLLSYNTVLEVSEVQLSIYQLKKH